MGQDGSRRISLPEPTNDASAHEETSRVQQLSSVAPPAIEDDQLIEITNDMPAFAPVASERQPLRMLGWVMVIGGAAALAIVLVVSKLRSAPAVEAAAPVAPAAVAVSVVAEPGPAPAAPEPALAPSKTRRGKRARADKTAEADVSSIRIRARVAPVRATADQDGQVVCSVKRGAVMRATGQTPGEKGRWFAVHCDKDSPGWVHENFVTPLAD